MEKKRPNPHTLPPDFRSRQDRELVRDKRLVINVNERELKAIEKYQASLKGISKSSICREAIMEKVLRELGENQPTLF